MVNKLTSEDDEEGKEAAFFLTPVGDVIKSRDRYVHRVSFKKMFVALARLFFSAKEVID